MQNSASLPHLTAPAFRETTNGKEWVQMIRGDLKQVQAQLPLWVRSKTVEVIKQQHKLGNSEHYTAVVDGNKSKPIAQAERKVVVYFVTAVLTRSLGRAKDVLRKAILRVTERRTGALSEGWTWFILQGGKRGTLRRLGDTLPTDLTVKSTDVLILAPRAGYAWFANYRARHSAEFILKARRPRKNSGTHADGRPAGQARAIGFMAYAAKQLRPELKAINFRVQASWTVSMPPGPAMGWRSRRGVPILVFKASRMTTTPGVV
jgi:hypothetical protein